MRQKVLVLAAHPDDELLGCGGLLHHYSNTPDIETHVAIIASRRKRDGQYDQDLSEQLRSQALDVKTVLGVDEYHFADLPDETLQEQFAELRQYVEHLRNTLNPDVIFVHGPNDINQDHHALFQAAKIAFRLQRMNRPFELYTYEVLSSTDQGYHPFHPNLFVPLTWDDVDAKGRAMKLYTSEVNDARSYEGISHQARVRGIQSGTMYAEAFRLEQARR